MASIRVLLVGLGLLAAPAAHAQNVLLTGPGQLVLPPFKGYPAYTLGAFIGWGAPYGWGIEVGRLVQPHLDVNAGLGFSINGGKIGVGSRYYFTPERQVSAFVGSNLVYSMGQARVVFDGGTTATGLPDELTVRYRPAGLGHLQGGVRWQPSRFFAVLGAVGYGLVLTGETIDYRGATSYSRATQRQAQQMAPGGIEFYYGVALGIR